MRESVIEARLKKLEQYGFKVIKLRTPGVNGVPDRMILRPVYAPGSPYFVEIKAPGKTERALQEAVREDWKRRGMIVLSMCDTIEKVDALVQDLQSRCGHLRLSRIYVHSRTYVL